MTAIPDLTRTQARALRMSNLLLERSSSAPSSVAGIVEWFGAMQAQDESSVLWSLGIRLPGSWLASLQKEFDQGSVVRTWPMRGTVHLIPALDAHWMLELMAGRPLAGAKARREDLGISEAIAEQAVQVLADALSGGRSMTRAECLTTLADAGIAGPGQFGYHLLVYASHRGVIAMTPRAYGVQTFVLLDEWVTSPRRLGREQALATMAVRYFRSHGPASRLDFSGWTGLIAADVRQAIAEASELAVVRVDGQTMWVAAEALDRSNAVSEPGNQVLAVPGFDEYLLGFKERALMIDPGHLQAIIPGANGIFRPTFVRGGQVIGTWTRKVSKSRITVEAMPLAPMRAADRRAVEQSLEPFGAFHQLPVEVRWPA